MNPDHFQPRKQTFRAFTLIELPVVAAISASLAAVQALESRQSTSPLTGSCRST